MNARRRQRRRRRFLPYVYKHSRCDSIPIVRFDRFTPASFLARPRALPPSRETKREDKLVSFTRARMKRYIGGISWFVNRQNDTIGFKGSHTGRVRDSETNVRDSETPRRGADADADVPFGRCRPLRRARACGTSHHADSSSRVDRRSVASRRRRHRRLCVIVAVWLGWSQ